MPLKSKNNYLSILKPSLFYFNVIDKTSNYSVLHLAMPRMKRKITFTIYHQHPLITESTLHRKEQSFPYRMI